MEKESHARNKPTKALRTSNFGSVAQSVEQWPFKPLVPGSSPGRPTTCPTEKLNPLVGMWGTGCPVEGIASYPNSNNSEFL